MSVQKYETFLKIVELGSISKAADVLGYSQSALSHVVAGLESEWSIRLLVRDKQGVHLSTEGELLLPTIREVVRVNKGLLHQISELHQLENGLIRVGAFHSAAVNLLPGLVKSFQGVFPKVQFEVKQRNYYEIEKMIVDGKLDCGIIRLPARYEIDALPLIKDPLVAVFQEGQAPEGDSFPIAAIAHENYLMTNHMEFEIVEHIEKNQIKLGQTTQADYNLSLLAMIANGIGMCILPEMMLRDTSFPLETRKLDPPAYRTIGLGFNRDLLSEATRRFVRHTQEYVRGRSEFEILQTI